MIIGMALGVFTAQASPEESGIFSSQFGGLVGAIVGVLDDAEEQVDAL